jgi:DNA-binding CsgD family transcriptional regulator
MTPERFRQLTDGQQACLRLVYEHRSSKEIARELGISKDTVDQRLDRARAILGAGNRFEAARAFAGYEAGCHRVVYDPPSIADQADHLASMPTSGGQSQTATTVREEQAVYSVPPLAPMWPFGLPLQLSGERRNDLTTRARLTWIAIISAAIPVVLGSLIVGLWALGQIALTLVQ